jgi:hypothetical protein
MSGWMDGWVGELGVLVGFYFCFVEGVRFLFGCPFVLMHR